jgi:hypothetical protein
MYVKPVMYCKAYVSIIVIVLGNAFGGPLFITNVDSVGAPPNIVDLIVLADGAYVKFNDDIDVLVNDVAFIDDNCPNVDKYVSAVQ